MKKPVGYFRARTLERSAENNLFKVRMNGKDLVQLTPNGENVTDVNLSPTGKYMVVTHGNLNKPSITLF
jgi:Tol biopolymer transport system component